MPLQCARSVHQHETQRNESGQQSHITAHTGRLTSNILSDVIWLLIFHAGGWDAAISCFCSQTGQLKCHPYENDQARRECSPLLHGDMGKAPWRTHPPTPTQYPTCLPHNHKNGGLYLFTGVISLSEMNGLAYTDGPKWFGTAWMTLRLTLRADTSLSLCVIWNEGRAHCSPCIYHAALATIINLTRHLPYLHNHLHLQSLLVMLIFFLSFFFSFFLSFPFLLCLLYLCLPLPPSLSSLHLSRLPLPQSLNIVFLISTVALINGIVQREWKADGFITQTNIIASETVAQTAMIPA